MRRPLVAVAVLLATMVLCTVAYAQTPPTVGPVDARNFGSVPFTATGGNTARTNAAITADVSNVLGFGADPTGGTSSDNSVAINLAAANTRNGTVANVYLPAGTYHLKHAINLSSGQCLVGDGMGLTDLTIGSDFDSTATGVITLSGREAASPCVHDLRITGSTVPDAVTTSSAQTIGNNTLTLASVSNISIGSYIYDATSLNAIPRLTTVSNIVGNVVTLSNNVASPGVSNGDTIDTGPARAAYATLAAGCTTTVGGTGCKYPPFIISTNSNRVNLYNIWLEGAWDGINLTNSGGGADLHDIMLGTLDVGIAMDQMFDFSHLTTIHVWNFGFNGVQSRSTFQDGGVIAGSFGRIDGFDVKGFSSWQGSINILSAASGSADPFTFSNILLDSGALNVTNVGQLDINNITFQCGSGVGVPCTGVPLISQAAGRVYASNVYMGTTGTVPSISVTGGTLNIRGGYLFNDGTVGVATVSAGTLNISASDIGTHSAALASPLITQSGTGIVRLTGAPRFSSSTSNSTALSLTVYNASAYVGPDIVWNGLGFLQPGGNAGATNGSILYNTPGTYTYYPTPGVTTVYEVAMGGGGGGGGGARTGTTASGGGSGAGAARCTTTWRVSDKTISSGLSIVVGAGGSFGAAATGDTLPGSAGGLGGDTTAPFLTAFGAGGGSGGAIGTASAGGSTSTCNSSRGSNASGATPGSNGPFAQAAASGANVGTFNVPESGGSGTGSSAAGAAFHGGTPYQGGPGGGTGGGIASGPASVNGGTGACAGMVSATAPAGGTSGTPNGGSQATNPPYNPGCSGGGGYGNASGNAGNGGTAGPGAGGGGGGSAFNGNTAGNGTKGGDGFVYIVEEY